MVGARPLHWRHLSSLCRTRDTHQPINACSRIDVSVLLLAQTQPPGHIPTSTQASKPGPLTSHRTADSPFHRSPSSSHSSSTGELGFCHLWGSSVFGRLLLSGPLLRVFDHLLTSTPSSNRSCKESTTSACCSARESSLEKSGDNISLERGAKKKGVQNSKKTEKGELAKFLKESLALSITL